MTLLHTEASGGCPVCGGACRGYPTPAGVFPDRLPRRNSVKPEDGVPAPDRIFVNERLKYAPGDIVPRDEAIALGLIPADQVAEPEAATPAAASGRRRRTTSHARRGPEETTAVDGPDEDR